MPPVHVKSLTSPYPQSQVQRTPVKPDQVPWHVSLPDYKPQSYTDPSVQAEPFWADKDRDRPNMKFNAKDGKVDRTTFCEYGYDVIDNMPQNPRGRTGLAGRGLLGKFGPNHAADPIVSRWKRSARGEVIIKNGLPVLEIVFIKRRDNGQWALPGGMVDAGDTVGRTLSKEFGEEALASIESGPEKAAEIKAIVDKIFQAGGELIYSGYVDDPRNTDNAWMETTAVNFHDETGEAFGEIPLQAGDDAGDVAWVEATPSMELFASHIDFVRMTLKKRHAAYQKQH